MAATASKQGKSKLNSTFCFESTDTKSFSNYLCLRLVLTVCVDNTPSIKDYKEQCVLIEIFLRIISLTHVIDIKINICFNWVVKKNNGV